MKKDGKTDCAECDATNSGLDSAVPIIPTTLPNIHIRRLKTQETIPKYATSFPPPIPQTPNKTRHCRMRKRPTVHRSYTEGDEISLVGKVNKHCYTKASTKTNTRTNEVPLTMRVQRFVTDLDLYCKQNSNLKKFLL